MANSRGLRHRPVLPASYGEETAKKRVKELFEARRAGNIDFDIDADWIDYESAGVADAEQVGGGAACSLPCARGGDR